MKVFRNLTVQGDSQALATILAEIDQRLKAGWTHDFAFEKNLDSTIRGTVVCYACTDLGERIAATLCLSTGVNGTLEVVNVIPLTKGQLSKDEYNGIVVDFHNNVLAPATEATGAVAELTDDNITIDALLPSDVFGKLMAFSRLANRSTASAHPMDFRRWLRFIIAVHSTNTKLSYSLLTQWLVEDEHWPDDIADRLGTEFEFGLSLLSAYDAARNA